MSTETTNPTPDAAIILGPAVQPCGTCPYRRDVPAGVWAADEYAKLPRYDADTAYQPPNLFLCHQVDGHLCAGWVGCHGGGQLLAVRIAALTGGMDSDAIQATVNYTCPVPLFESGAAAAAYGRSGVADPEVPAQRAIAKLLTRRGRSVS